MLYIYSTRKLVNIQDLYFSRRKDKILRPVGENGFLEKSENVYVCRKLGEKAPRFSCVRRIAAAKANARGREPVNFSVPNVSVNPPADL